MCGIAGIIQVNNSDYNKDHLHKMTNALAHRGPDGERTWQNKSGNALLGHRRLAIIDLTESGAQPMHYLDRYTIIHNGEIYNYIELREELRKAGYTFQTESDTEVILAAFDHWEEDCIDHFDGMYAFAIWDEMEGSLFAARDPFGEKPFFYYHDNDRFIFGSEMKAIFAAGIERKMNYKMLFNFFTIGYVDNPEDKEETFYENIKKLPPSSTLYCMMDGATSPKLTLVTETIPPIDIHDVDKKIKDGEATEKFRELLSNSIKRRLRSDVPIGSSLSGGLDSSSVVAIASKLSNTSFDSFTAIFPGFAKDEAEFAATVSRQFKLQNHTVAVTGEDLMNDWTRFCHHQEEPFGSASAYAQYKVYELAARSDVRVLLDGQGADETLAGYHNYYKWYWQELFIRRKLLSSGELSAAKSIGVNQTFGFRNVIASLFPDLASVILERRYLLNAIRQEDLTKDFVKQQSKEAYYTTPEYFNLSGVLYFNTCEHGLEELLRYADRNSMAHGREVRLPFLEPSLVKFLFTLPSHYKIRKGWTKWLLRESMQQELPKEITWRKDKVGFEPPQQQWMEHPAVHEAIREARKKMVTHGILKKDVVDKPIRSLASHEGGNYDWRYLSAAAYL